MNFTTLCIKGMLNMKMMDNTNYQKVFKKLIYKEILRFSFVGFDLIQAPKVFDKDITKF